MPLHLSPLHHAGQGRVHLWPRRSAHRHPERAGHLARLLDAGRQLPRDRLALSGEIDILENVGEKNVVYGALHGPGYSGAGNIGHVYRADVNFDEGFHVYAIDWDENVIRWYVDGELVNLTSAKDLDGAQWVYDHDFFLLMNVAVGGYWPGNPDETTTFPQEMIVDYVRVYQLAEA